jgi:hypothetical protein
MMEVPRLFLRLVEITIWPATVLIIFLILRGRIERLLDRFTKSPHYEIEKEVAGLTEVHVELLKIIEMKKYDFDTVFEHVKKTKLMISTASDLESNLNYLIERGLVRYDAAWKLYSLTRKGTDVLVRIV